MNRIDTNPTAAALPVRLIFIASLLMLIGSFLGVWAPVMGWQILEDAMGPMGLRGFRYFTILSNAAAGPLAAAMAVICIALRVGRISSIPKWLELCWHLDCVALTLTFVTTAVFLCPQRVAMGDSYFLLFSGVNFFNHFLTPMLSIAVMDLLDRQRRLPKSWILLGVVPVAVYAAVYLYNVVWMKSWPDFYGFTFGGRYQVVPMVVLVVLGASCGMSALHICLHNRHIGES